MKLFPFFRAVYYNVFILKKLCSAFLFPVCHMSGREFLPDLLSQG